MCPGLCGGLLTALQMKGMGATLIRHLLCPSREGAGHSEMSQPWSQALDTGRSARLGVRTPGLNPHAAIFQLWDLGRELQFCEPLAASSIK